MPKHKRQDYKPGVGRSNFDNSVPVEILYVQGGDRNIDRSRYENSELLLPKSLPNDEKILQFDGQYFEGEEGFDSANARTYIADADGLSIRRKDKLPVSQAEDSLDCSNIYPSRVGNVTRVVWIYQGVEYESYKEAYDAAIAVDEKEADKILFDFFDATNKIIDYSKCGIKGSVATVIFQTGMLAGKEFDIATDSNGNLTGYVHSDSRFKLVRQEIDGVMMPGGAFAPSATVVNSDGTVGDKYVVLNCMLPDEYIREDETKFGASWDMFREGVKYLYEHEQQKFTFTGEMDGIWAKKNWDKISHKIKLGGFVLFSDARFAKDGVLVRIIGIKDFVNNPHSPVVELSNSPVGSTSILNDLRKIDSNEALAENKYKESVEFSRRRYSSAQETMSLLENALLSNYTSAVSPIAVQTMLMLVGDESLQYKYYTEPEVERAFYFDSGKMYCAGGTIVHQTLGIEKITSPGADKDLKSWSMPATVLLRTEDDKSMRQDKGYYLYAKVEKQGATSPDRRFVVSETAIKMEEVAEHYHLLVGILNSEVDGIRDFVPMYGFTEIRPGQITTDRIASTYGDSYLDLAGNSFRVGDDHSALEWNVDQRPDGTGLFQIVNALIKMVNKDNKTMINLSGEDGSGILAGGNLQWDANGKIQFKVDETTEDRIEIDMAQRALAFRNSKGNVVGFWAFTDEWGSLIRIDSPDKSATLGLSHNFITLYSGAKGLRIETNNAEYPDFLKIEIKGLKSEEDSVLIAKDEVYVDANGFLKIK